MHTVAEVGFWRDPKILAFAAKVKNPDAGAWILRLREFVLTHGTDAGALPGYSADEVVAIMRPTCSQLVLFSALHRFHQLGRKGRCWYIPYWKKSQMGRYCRIRSWDRKRKEEFRDAHYQVGMDSVNGDSSDLDLRTSVGRPTDVRRNSAVSKAILRTSPPRPPQGGVSGRASLARWEWFKSVYPKISSPERCIRLLANLTPEEWDHLQWALPKQMASNRCLREGGRWCPRSPKYLSEKRFLELRRGSPPKSGLKKGQKKKLDVDPLSEKKRFAVKYLFDFLRDPDRPPGKKEALMKRYFENWGEKPWEKV